MNAQQMMEEIDRLARLCEAKDAEIERLTGMVRLGDVGRDARIEYLNQQISMQAEALRAVENWDESLPVRIDSLVTNALSATSETVAAWRAKETEPLRREVAMISNKYRECAYYFGEEGYPAYLEECNKILSDTQATALAYEREVKAKALEEFGEKYRCVYLVHRGAEVYVGPELKELADKEAAELRAANKGEVK